MTLADESGRGRAGTPLTMRWLRVMLAVPATRSLLNCSSSLSWAVVFGVVPLTASDQVRIR